MPLSRRCAVALLAGSVGLVMGQVPAGAGAGEAAGPQWGLDEIGAPTAWTIATGAGVTIAVVDSGVDLDHEDLREQLVAEVSCVGADEDPARCHGPAQDDHGHGTHVAGIAVATADNGVGVAGVAPGADLMAVRVLVDECDTDAADCTPAGSAGDVAAGIRWAADHDADVINLSLGGAALRTAAGCSICAAVEYAWDRGAVPVIAAGNDALLPDDFGDLPAVIVTATARDDRPASYARAGSPLLRTARWAVAAPGGEAERGAEDCATGRTPQGILSTHWVAGEQDRYACLAGTSMAAPHVSGALAVLLSTGLTASEAIDRLLATAADLGAPGRDAVYGVGRIDLAAAVGLDASLSPAATTEATERSPRGLWTAVAVSLAGVVAVGWLRRRYSLARASE